MGGLITLLFLIFLAFGGFVIYLMFKAIQFTVQAVNLYKEMIARQDTMIKLLKDLRDVAGSENGIRGANPLENKLNAANSAGTEDPESEIPAT